MGEDNYAALYRRGSDHPVSVGKIALVEACIDIMRITYGGEYCTEKITQAEAEILAKEVKRPLGNIEWKVRTPDWVVPDEVEELL